MACVSVGVIKTHSSLVGHLALVGKWAMGHKGKRLGKEREAGEGRRSAR